MARDMLANGAGSHVRILPLGRGWTKEGIKAYSEVEVRADDDRSCLANTE